MSRDYYYSIYKIQCFGKPVGRQHFFKLISNKSLEDILYLQLNRYLDSYKYYVEKCEYKGLTPLTVGSYSKTRNDKNFWSKHKRIQDSEFTREDKLYILEQSINNTERKSFINQNMCLWWKNYLKKRET